MLKKFQNHFKFFWGCMVCFGVPMPPQPRDRPRVFWGFVFGSFMCGYWKKTDVEPVIEMKLELIIQEQFVPANAVVIKVSDFSRMPAGRYSSDGPYSAEDFRVKHLLPGFIMAETLGVMFVVDTRGTIGYAYNWIEEAFGGLTNNFTSERLLQRMRIVAGPHPWDADDIMSAIEHAEYKRKEAM